MFEEIKEKAFVTDEKQKNILSKFVDFFSDKKVICDNLKKSRLIFLLIIIFLAFFSIPFIVNLIKSPQEIKEGKATTSTKKEWKSQEDLIKSGIIPPAEQILEINLSYNAISEEPFSVIAVYRKNGYAPKMIEDFNEYYLKIQDGEEKILYEKSFEAPNKISGAPPLDGKNESEEDSLEINEMNFSIVVPWYEDVKNILIVDKEEEVLLSYSVVNLEIIDNQQQFRSIGGEEIKDKSENEENGLLSFFKKIISPAKAQAQQEYLDLVFISEDFTQDQMDRFHSDVERMSQHLLTYEPFDQRAFQIFFHTVDNTNDLGCYFYDRTPICDSAKVTNAVNDAGVPYDRIMVIWNNPSHGGAAWLGGIGMICNDLEWSSEVYVHEMGHSLARLADEYLAYYPYNDLDKNCYNGTPPNQAWIEQVGEAEYHLSCNYPGWYRPTEDSIMRSLSARYFNNVSIYWINKYIDLLASEYVYPTSTPTNTPTQTPTPTITSTPTPTPTSSDSINPTSTPTPGITSTSTPTPTTTPGSSPTPTDTPTPSPTPTPSSDPLTLTYPNGGEIFNIGEDIHFTWDSNVSGTCSLDYYNWDVGFTNGVSGPLDCSQEYYDWTVTWPYCPACPPPWPQSPPVDGYFRIHRWDSSDQDSTNTMSRIDP